MIARTDDGVELALHRAVPDTPNACPPVLLVHGTFSNRNFFYGTAERGFAFELARLGFDAWVAELRGHGRSGATGRAASWRFEDWIRRDAPALIEAVCAHSGNSRVTWIGHSAGGIIGAAFAGLGGATAARIAGLVLAAAPAPVGLGALQRAGARAAHGIARMWGRFPARLLGIGPEDEHAGIFAQWMEWNLRSKWHGDDGTDYFANCTNITAPVLVLAGAGDTMIAPPRACRALLEACGSSDTTFVRCGRAEGFSEDFGHNRLLISKSARAEVWPLMMEWMEKRFA